MGENSAIEWCDHTFNPWIGCTKVSPGCTNCYAETLMDLRWGKVEWGPGKPRLRTHRSNWRKPVKWNEKASERGVRAKVFCASLADVFDEEADQLWREDLAELISETPHLDWLLLTKRPENIRRLWPGATTNWGNVWWGISAESQQTYEQRLPHILSIEGKVHWVSYEPALERVNFHLERGWCRNCKKLTAGSITGHCMDTKSPCFEAETALPIDWIIVGGESGPNARTFDMTWARSTIEQCRAAGTACFVKQLGAKSISTTPCAIDCSCHLHHGYYPVDRKDGDPSEWPVDLRVREFPR